MTTLEQDALRVPMNWDEGGAYHNWRNHVGENVRAIWNKLPGFAKIAIAKDAEDRANAEEWE
jgi:hypothetical protein